MSQVQFDFDIPKAIDFADDLRLRGLRMAVLEGVNVTKFILGSQFQDRTGRVYTRGTVSHQASAPNEAPAPDTGTLRNSVQGDVFDNLTGVVSANTDYAAHLELGTERMAPRPYLSLVMPMYGDRIFNAFKVGASG